MDSATIREGMSVYSADGKKLGKIINHDDDTLIVEKGLFFKKDYVVGYEDVDEVKEDEVWLRVTSDEIEGERVDESAAPRAPARAAVAGEEGLSAAAPGEAEVVVMVEEVEVVAEPPAGGESPGSGQRKDPDTKE